MVAALAKYSRKSSTFVQFSDLGAYHRAWCGVCAQVVVVE